MRKVLAWVLTFLLLVSMSPFAIAEEDAFSLDEQAYSVYLDLTFVCEQTVQYMKEMSALWGLSFKVDKLSDVTNNMLLE